MAVDVGADGHDEFFQVAEYAAPEPILSQVTKEAFHHIRVRRRYCDEPGRVQHLSILLFASLTSEKLRPSTYTVYLSPHTKLGMVTNHRGEWAFKSCRGGWVDMRTIIDFLREHFRRHT